jgi:hypothetical protein
VFSWLVEGKSVGLRLEKQRLVCVDIDNAALSGKIFEIVMKK